MHVHKKEVLNLILKKRGELKFKTLIKNDNIQSQDTQALI